MRSIGALASCLVALVATGLAEVNVTEQISRQIFPSSFTPPQVFQHANLVRTISLAKSYGRETVNVVVENIDKKEQSEYYIPFQASTIARIGNLEVRDKNNDQARFKEVESVEFDSESGTQYYRVKFPKALAPKDKVTLSISWVTLSSLNPLPAKIEQTAKQYVQYSFSAFTPSAYKTIKQKTNIKLPSVDVPEYTKLEKNEDGKEDPQKQGTTFTYGPYANIPAGATQQVSLRYEFTKPLLHASLLERDIEVSHWGGNLATEERYWLENRGAELESQFSRVKWQQSQYYNPPTSAAKELHFPLAIGSLNPYFTDDIGNVSTSRFRSNSREANLELKPRYPLFGGWKYKFRIGWDSDVKRALRKLKTGDGYVLKVPFLEGPKESEGVEYEKVVLSIMLPEGATNVNFDTTAHIISSETTIQKSFMDTVGRTSLKLTAINVVDDARDRDVIVTYDYPFTAGFRKPIVITSSIFGLFVAAWAVSQLDVSIGRKR
ncbi:Dolichyl-diphosphooligosaccharide--protein glycosyltransferase subunit 1 [Sphaceloma murrayae]|uniref:Dolichyl-diphosphooligosaccharide--protein glycosyltransferase subunit 1 n=1 Tax=Sphaceloma murrayae TaxID=2082308 RepID=A0A2K1R2X3_9PEZI|nr:Dolichyl-diphosphooligosaccharide--protein glycosyltransferase subunit 1 [Sphaceloma murrayae]